MGAHSFVKMKDVRDSQTGLVITIKLDRDRGNFYIEFQGQSYTGKTADEVEKKAREWLAASRQLEWKPYIGIDYDDHEFTRHTEEYYRSFEANVRLGFFRIEAALRPGALVKGKGEWKSDQWLIRPFIIDPKTGATDKDLDDGEVYDTLDEHRRDQVDARREWTLRDRESNSDWKVPYGWHDEHLIPYTEERWTALTHLRETILQTKEKMQALLSQESIEKTLDVVAARLNELQLTAGDKPSKKDMLQLAVRVPVKPKDWEGKRVRLKCAWRNKGGDVFEKGEVLKVEGVWAKDNTLSLVSLGRTKGRKEKRRVGIRGIPIEEVELVP